MNKPLVSVIIPAYNAASLILETIDSLLKQTYSPIEIIVVDDGSADDTARILKSLKESGKIKYFYQENSGQAAARLRGFKESQGAFISFIDSDDLIAFNKIELQVDYLEKNLDCGVVYSDILHFWHHEPDKLLRKKLNYYSGYIFDKLIKENFIQVMTALIRRNVLEKYGMPDSSFRRSDDWYLWLNLSYHGVKFCFMDKILSFQRRQLRGSLSDQKSYFKETAGKNIEIYERFKKILKTEDISKFKLDRAINFWQFRLVLGYIILDNKVGAIAALSGFRVFSFIDFVKKYSLKFLLYLTPVSLLGRIIFAIREYKRFKSFIEFKDKSIKLPK